MKLETLSSKYRVRRLVEEDVEAILDLCQGNPQYYQYYPQAANQDNIRESMLALPPRKTRDDKYFLGYYQGDTLIAILDLIMGFPNDQTAYIGWFMMLASIQGKGTGSYIVQELLNSLAEEGMTDVGLAHMKGNQQAGNFWQKQGFVINSEDDTHVNLRRGLRCL